MSTSAHHQPVKLTKSVVDHLPAPVRGQAFVRDTVLKGFGLRITASGAKAFILEKRVAGRVRRQTIGRYPELTVEQARKQAHVLLGKIALGIDPVAEQHAKRTCTTTLPQAFADYVKARKDLKPKTLKDYTRFLERDFSDWRKRPMTIITKTMVATRHQELGKRRGPAHANGAMRFLRALLNFARHTYDDGKGRSILPENPVEYLNHTRAWYRVDRRRTVIKRHQLPAWYAAVKSLKEPGKPITAQVVADFLLFVLFTGLRLNEAAKLRWTDVDLKDRTLLIPDPKNRQPLTLPLTDFLMDLLLERQALALNEYVFPGRDGAGHLVEAKRQIAHVRETSGVHFTVHDLRRTFITVADSLDISAYAIKRLVNHKIHNDVTAGYIVSDIERLRPPMQRITDFLVGAMEIEYSPQVVYLDVAGQQR